MKLGKMLISRTSLVVSLGCFRYHLLARSGIDRKPDKDMDGKLLQGVRIQVLGSLGPG